MFGKSIKLFKLFGFSVKVDMSWIIIAILVAWSLSVGLFPHQFKGLAARTYWLMGIVGALGLFASIIFHEMCHSLVARQFGLPMKGITLFIFGGVAEMDDEPPSAKAEFMMAIAGPISSIVLAVGFYAVSLLGKSAPWPGPVTGVLQYLGMINGLLAAFNLVPAFPLDGGRVLRAALWSWKKNIKWATRKAAAAGSAFGLVLIILGVFNVLAGRFVGGMWWFLIGMFLRGAANTSYQQLVIRQALEGEPIRRFMEPNPVTVPPSITINELVEDYVYKYHFKMFPVTEEGKLVGCVSTRQVKEIPREEWSQRTVGELQVACSDENTIEPDADSVKALSRMRKTDGSRLMVVENGRVVGIVSLKDLLQFLSLKVELEEES
ncbi:MAG: CBS domain-containing protein [Candidatus Abyssobacteria bacterium SURF_17]|jgi:Zn-dependent protease|uniref:Zinc metalloprotease n=1 Tax=Candidatus Abyssobacteria bacterium SURF_17 TaxID=2093361 RepID=A0A419ERC4_9BACT|nr:MAG: CBS domain-containing protein [Candidatus Abyssubacteria bacterium SURF_17]